MAINCKVEGATGTHKCEICNCSIIKGQLEIKVNFKGNYDKPVYIHRLPDECGKTDFYMPFYIRESNCEGCKTFGKNIRFWNPDMKKSQLLCLDCIVLLYAAEKMKLVDDKK